MIHLVISVFDQDTCGEIRSFKYDTLEHEGVRHMKSLDDKVIEFDSVRYAIGRLTERVDMEDVMSDYIIRDGSYLD